MINKQQLILKKDFVSDFITIFYQNKDKAFTIEEIYERLPKDDDGVGVYTFEQTKQKLKSMYQCGYIRFGYYHGIKHWYMEDKDRD